jgi:hypothetical protein
MKHLIFFSLIVLSSCGAEQAALTNNEAVRAASDEVTCNLPILGQWTNDGDQSSLSIYNDNGVCKFSMGCGASGTIVDMGQNDYELQDKTNSQSCGFPNNFTINGKVKQISAMIYQGKLLTAINNEPSNEWSK